MADLISFASAKADRARRARRANAKPRHVAMVPIATLNEIEDRMRRLAPDHRDPERFHMDRDELVTMVREARMGGTNQPSGPRGIA